METKGVKILLGDPKKAVMRLSFPVTLGLLFQSIYMLADGVWVAGLGEENLTALGLVFPVFMAVISISSGLGIGGSAAISRKIGRRDRLAASKAASQSLLLSFLTGIVIVSAFFPNLERIYSLIGASGEALELAVEYSKILFAGSVAMVFSNVAGGVLRGEGDADRSTAGMILGSMLNVVLDPIFIYSLGFGLNGAAISSVISFVATSLLYSYWLFSKRDTFVEISPRLMIPEKEIVFEILRVGAPSSVIQLTMSVAVFTLNAIISSIDIVGIAVFTSVWRVLMFAILPLIGLAVGTTSVVAAAYGSGDVEKMKTAFTFSVKVGVVVELVFASLFVAFSPEISHLFAYSEATMNIRGDLIAALRELSIFLPFAPAGMMASSFFQGVGRGEISLALTTLRTIVFQLLFAFVLGMKMGFGLSGVWFGIALGNVVAAILGYVLVLTYIDRFLNK